MSYGTCQNYLSQLQVGIGAKRTFGGNLRSPERGASRDSNMAEKSVGSAECRRRAKSAAITEALGDAIGGSAPSKIAHTLATLFFGSLQIKWPIVRLVWYGR